HQSVYKMKKTTKSILVSALTFFALNMKGQTLLHYWDFNDPTSVQTITAANVSVVSGASIAYTLGATTDLAYANGTGQNFDVNNYNARNGAVAGTHLRFNNPIGGSLVFSLPT